MEINIEKWLLENGFNDVVTNALLYQKNTPENAIKWLYVSDILKMFVEKECDGILVKLNKANVIKSLHGDKMLKCLLEDLQNFSKYQFLDDKIKQGLHIAIEQAEQYIDGKIEPRNV